MNKATNLVSRSGFIRAVCSTGESVTLSSIDFAAWVACELFVTWHSAQEIYSACSLRHHLPSESLPVSRPGRRSWRSKRPSCTSLSKTIHCIGGACRITAGLSWHTPDKAPDLSRRAFCGYRIASEIFLILMASTLFSACDLPQLHLLLHLLRPLLAFLRRSASRLGRTCARLRR